VQLGVPIAPSVPCVGAVTTAKLRDGLSTSLPDKVITAAVSSAVVTDCAFADGATFTAVTEIVTVPAVEVSNPSLDVNVKLSAPK
jgi:hypothetical protein